MQLSTTGRLIAAVAVVAFVAAGCSDDDAADGPTSTSTTTTVLPEASGDDVPEESDDGTVEVEMVDYAFEGLPASIEAGTKLRIINTSETELHEVVAIRLPDDESRSVEELMELPMEEAEAVLNAFPSTVLFAAPGGEQVDAVGDGTLSEPGRYAILCMVPTGADPDEFIAVAATSPGPPDVDGGPPHIVHGMFAELTVT